MNAKMQRVLLVVWGCLFALPCAMSFAISGVYLEWTDNTEADFDFYNVYRSQEDTGPFEKLNTEAVTVSEYLDTAVESGAAYYYTVTAVDSYGNESALSNVAQADLPVAQPPRANAGDDKQAAIGQSVTLDGSASTDSDGQITAYLWLQMDGPAVALADENSSITTFIAPNVSTPTTLTFQLYVWDNTNTRCVDPDQMQVVVQVNLPAADAGQNQKVYRGKTAALDGSASQDPDGTVESHLWVQVEGPQVELSDPNAAETSFVTPIVDTLTTVTFELYVWDNHANQCASPDRTTVFVHNEWPVAVVNDDMTVNEGDFVALDASNSTDPDGQVSGYLWSQAVGPLVALQNDTQAEASFIAPEVSVDTEFIFEVFVWDDELNRSDTSGLVVVTVLDVSNTAPVANAGEDQTVDKQSRVTVDGSNSSDPDGDALTYSWRQTSGPAITLDTANPMQSFTAPDVKNTERIVLELTVSDGRKTATDTVTITVRNRRPFQKW